MNSGGTSPGLAAPSVSTATLTLLCSAMFLNILNLSSVNIALPDIADDLGFSSRSLPWVISAYALTFAGFLLVGGRAADVLGRRRVLAVGFALFAVCAVADAGATSPGVLIGARAVQGVGAAAAVPAALGIIAVMFEEGEARSRALAAFATAGAVGFGSGLVLGGVLTDAASWRWVFSVTAVPAALLAVATHRMIDPTVDQERAAGGIDVPGAVTGTAGLVGLTFAFTNAGGFGWTTASTIVPLLAGVALVGVFVLIQARVRQPLMPLEIWKLPNFAPAMAVAFCLYAAWTAVVFHLTLTLQEVLGYSPTGAALALSPIAVGGSIGSTAAGRLLPRMGARRLLAVGLTTFGAGIGLLAAVGTDTTYWPHLFIAISLTILGNSLTFVAATASALTHSPHHLGSLLGGMFNTSVQVGGGLGLAVVSAVAATRLEPGAAGASLLGGYRTAFLTCAVIAVLGLATTLIFVRPSPSPPDPSTPNSGR